MSPARSLNAPNCRKFIINDEALLSGPANIGIGREREGDRNRPGVYKGFWASWFDKFPCGGRDYVQARLSPFFICSGVWVMLLRVLCDRSARRKLCIGNSIDGFGEWIGDWRGGFFNGVKRQCNRACMTFYSTLGVKLNNQIGRSVKSELNVIRKSTRDTWIRLADAYILRNFMHWIIHILRNKIILLHLFYFYVNIKIF